MTPWLKFVQTNIFRNFTKYMYKYIRHTYLIIYKCCIRQKWKIVYDYPKLIFFSAFIPTFLYVIIVVLFRFQSMEHYLLSSSTVSNPKKSLLCIFMVTLNPSNLNILLKKLLFHPKVKKKLCLKYIRLVV